MHMLPSAFLKATTTTIESVNAFPSFLVLYSATDDRTLKSAHEMISFSTEGFGATSVCGGNLAFSKHK